MFRDKKTGRWRAMVTVNGQRISKLCANRADAERFEYEAKVGLVKGDSRRERMTFETYAERWYEAHCKARKAPSQWRRDRKTIDRHLIPAFGPIRLADLRRAHLDELVLKLLRLPGKSEGSTMSPKAVNNIAVMAKGMLSVAVDWELVEKSPFERVRPLKVPERAYDFWTLSELESFTSAQTTTQAMARLVTVAFHTGLRAGELAALRAEDLDFKAGRIRVRATVCLTTGQRRESTKSRRIRWAAMNQAAKAALEPARFQQPKDSVFPMDVFWNLCRHFRKAARKAKVREIRFHDLRHSFASGLAMAGVPLLAIQREIGHESQVTTQRYAHLSPDYGAGITEVLCTTAAQLEERARKSGGPRGT